MKKNENELPIEQETEITEEVVIEKTESTEAPLSPKKPPINKKLMIGIIAGAVAVVAIVIALILILGGGGNHTCSFGEWTVVTEATCTAAGSKERVCSCGEKESEAIPATGHNWKDATCQTPKNCSNCFAIEGSTTSHSYTESIASPDALKSAASCTSAAVYYKSCTCGKVSTSDAETFTSGTASAHNYVQISSTEADCENAATETYACDCGNEYTDTIGSALGHNTNGATPVKEPVSGSSCEFVLTYTCTTAGCGKKVEGERISNHNYIASITTPATCKNDGVKTLACSCGDSYTETILKNSTGHNWIKGQITNGVRTDTCEHCSETKKVTVYSGTNTGSINSGSLKDTEIELNDASISLDNGVVDSIGDKSVTVSAEKLGNDDINSLLTPEQKEQVGNSPIYNFTINDGTSNIAQFGENNYVTITLPYELKTGEDVDSIAIWFINENGEVESIKATYNNGYVTFKTNHFSYYTVTRLTPEQRCALYGHSFTEQVYNGSCTSDGYIFKVCVRCHESEKTITSVAKGHDFATDVHAATCTENGYTVYDCKNCDYAYKKTEKAIGHIFESVEKEDSTCTVNGHETFGCKNCDEEYTEMLPKADHEMVEENIINEATCGENGSKMILCVCGEYVLVDIPATGDHDYKNGICSVCGQRNAASIKIDSIVIRTDNLSYTWSEKIDNNWVIGGKLEQINLAELMLYIEDGELHGAATGTAEYYTKYNNSTNTYALKAVIEDGFLYYHVDDIKGSIKQDIEGKVSLEELLYNRITPNKQLSEEMAAFFTETILPTIEVLAENNLDVAEEIIYKTLDILFTTEEKTDGSRIISLDYDKVNALSEKLYTLPIAEVVDHYFGEGTVDKLYTFALDLLNTEFTEIPGILEKQGVDAKELIKAFESFCEKTGLPLGVDLNDVLYGEDYADITFGMLIFGTDDNSYEDYAKEILDLIKESTLYDLIAPDYQEDAKEFVDGIIETVTDKALVSLTINPAGQLVAIDVEAKDLTFEYDDESHRFNGSVQISIGDRIEVTWGDIVDEIEDGIVIPEEMLEEDVQIDNFSSSGSLIYKGEEYYFSGRGFRVYMADYDRVLAYNNSYDCGDFRYYKYNFGTIGYSISYGELRDNSNETVYFIVRDDITGEIVELQMNSNGGATAIYNDGSQKTLTADQVNDPEKLAKAVFGGVMQDNFFTYDYLSFYYNAKTKEVSEDSVHDYEIEYELQGDNCEDGVIVTHTCKNCGDTYTRNRTWHESYTLDKIDLAALGSVCGGYAEIRGCACGYYYDIYLDGDGADCDFSTHWCPIWIEEAIKDNWQLSADGDQYFSYNSYYYVCAVTHPEQCGYKVRYANYWVAEDNCTASYYKVWQFGYNEETGTYAREIKVKTDSNRVYHNYVSTDISTASTYGTRYTCADCGSYYTEITYYNSNGDETKFERIAENTLGIGNRYYQHTQTFQLDGSGNRTGDTNYTKYIYNDGSTSEQTYVHRNINGYSYIISEYYEDSHYWYKYDYTYDFSGECTRTCTFTNSEGDHWVSTDNCCKNEYSTIKYPTCSQSGLEGYHCYVCGKQSNAYTVSPYDHSWYSIDDGYFCTRCGLENINGSSGSVIFEDLTYQHGNGTHYVVGYYCRSYTTSGPAFTYYVSFILPDETEIILEGIDFIELSDPRAIKFSKAQVESALARLGYSMSDGHVRFAFVPFDDSGELDYAITFTDQSDVDNITGDVSFVQYVGADERVRFTINPAESGTWIFTSHAEGDTCVYLYDAYGNYISYDDDSAGYYNNFMLQEYLEAGETYIVEVKWFSSERSGQMPLLFKFIG
ncbi:MAG: hypothetical protein J6V80_03440 [Clostridia bacterium]|nr:hypothetical protein [Clostridia bacterium]